MVIIICQITSEFIVFISNIAQLILKLLLDHMAASTFPIPGLFLLLSEIPVYEICFEIQKDKEFCHLVLHQWPRIVQINITFFVVFDNPLLKDGFLTCQRAAKPVYFIDTTVSLASIV